MQEVVFSEGHEVRRLKGDIVDYDKDGFLIIRTLSREFMINHDKVIKIERRL